MDDRDLVIRAREAFAAYSGLGAHPIGQMIVEIETLRRQIDREPDGYVVDDTSGELGDLLDDVDPHCIVQVTPYWSGDTRFAVTHYDEHGVADHEVFATRLEAEGFLKTVKAIAAEDAAEDAAAGN